MTVRVDTEEVMIKVAYSYRVSTSMHIITHHAVLVRRVVFCRVVDHQLSFPDFFGRNSCLDSVEERDAGSLVSC